MTIPPSGLSSEEIITSILGCKWSLRVLTAIRDGTTRPGALERACAGISTKVLHERLAKLTRLGVLERVAYPEIPPRVEYRLTPRGAELEGLLDEIARVAKAWDQPSQSPP